MNISAFSIQRQRSQQHNSPEDRIGELVLSGDNRTGSYTFKPAANFNGIVRFDYTISDGNASLNQTHAIEVSSVNDAPSGADKTLRTTAGEFVTLSPGDFGFSDVIDRDVMQSVKLKLANLNSDNLEIVGDFITDAERTAGEKLIGFEQLAEGKVSIKAGAISTRTQIAFSVIDDGETTNGTNESSEFKLTLFAEPPASDDVNIINRIRVNQVIEILGTTLTSEEDKQSSHPPSNLPLVLMTRSGLNSSANTTSAYSVQKAEPAPSRHAASSKPTSAQKASRVTRQNWRRALTP